MSGCCACAELTVGVLGWINQPTSVEASKRKFASLKPSQQRTLQTEKDLINFQTGTFLYCRLRLLATPLFQTLSLTEDGLSMISHWLVWVVYVLQNLQTVK